MAIDAISSSSNVAQLQAQRDQQSQQAQQAQRDQQAQQDQRAQQEQQAQQVNTQGRTLGGNVDVSV